MQSEIFSKVKYPRVLGKVKHELEDVLRIALIGVLCSCEDYDEIYDMVVERQEDLVSNGFLKLSNGVPSSDTIRRVVEAVNPDQMRASINCSVHQIQESLKGCQIIIDGKKLRGENPKSLGCNGLFLLNAMVSESEICIAEKRVDNKTNELSMLPSMLASLYLPGTVVSVDAMGTHRNISEQILMQGGDYLMALKENQPIMCQLVNMIFNSSKVLSACTKEEKGHGRIEKRTCTVIGTNLLEKEGMYQSWPGLKRIIKIERERTTDGRCSKETVYYLSSEQKDDALYYADRIRAHWGIENNLHWHLDVTFKEDKCRVRTKNGAVNLSTLRKAAMDMLKKQDDKLSLKRRRKKCLMSIGYLAQVLSKS